VPEFPAPAAARPAGAALDVRGLTVRWDAPDGRATALDGLDLAVPGGSTVAVVGPSGCGKSTLLRVLAGLLPADAGSAAVGGRSVVGRPGTCAWMPQRDALLPWRRVLANAVLGAEVAGVRLEHAEQEARGLLERFGLGDVVDAWPRELSGGMRQRVAVLRAVLTPAPVLLLDEPFGALDALTRRQVQLWLQEVLGADAASGEPRTVVLVTHDVEEALLLADRVAVMSAAPGRIVADVAVPFPRPRPATLVAEPEFVDLRRRLLDLLGA
jgi:ABC-type nitrate/sulfonate/bicarbonate transport system ATPase subunit